MAVDKLLYYCDFPISQVGEGTQQVQAISSSVNVPPTPGYPLRSSQTPLFLPLTLCLQGPWLPSCPCAWKAISKAQGWAHFLHEAHQRDHSPSSDCHGIDVHTLSSWFCTIVTPSENVSHLRVQMKLFVRKTTRSKASLGLKVPAW